VITIHGWTILAHPCFLDQAERLLAAVEREATRNPDGFERSADFKVLSSIVKLAFDEIPQDPAHKKYRHGGAIEGTRRHWFRAKFGNGRFRLFFRFHSGAKIIVYAWVNDEHTLRTYGSDTDAYVVFGHKLDTGNPPDDWDALVAESQRAEVQQRVTDVNRKTGSIARRKKK
jgi:toxin YhaV